ncbi:putative Ig domain-containing protein [Larkinella rosea]|uniref:T9SS C-terminal target domain-containing protein n=1 Tax=Larkinella rosea TaxID=2025312 RepID=A0A3P1BHA3_9BACT|nr:putative Ig domain-containing protein [Larkinella rosea]RRA99983.1 T9SS C-terminal target domain-containing protein [Larkinella rosea]
MKKIVHTYFNRRWLPVLLFLMSTCLQAQVTKVFDKTIGGNSFEQARIILPLADGFLLGGISPSGISGDRTTANLGFQDFWIVKVDANGNKIWDKTYGGSGYDDLYTIVASPDGGFLLGGSSDSNKGNDKSEDGRGNGDFWIVKIDENGTKQWDKTFGGEFPDDLIGIAVLPENKGYLLAGTSQSPPTLDRTAPLKGAGDYWVVRVDLTGNKIWDKSFGGNSFQRSTGIVPTSDGKFVLTGSSSSNAGGDKTENVRGTVYDFSDYWLVKIDADGTKIWDKTLGGDNEDEAAYGVPTPDGGVVIAGTSRSNQGFEKSANSLGGADYWIVRVGANGNKVWDKTLGGTQEDYGIRLLPTADGGFLAGGFSRSNRNAIKSENCRGDSDFWLIKLGADGTWLWDKTLGGNNEDRMGDVAQSASGDFYVLGDSFSDISGDKTEEAKGETDYWLVALHETPCTTPSPTITINATASPILQHTPGVMITVDGCESGQISWTDPDGAQGVGPFIPVSTAVIGSRTYSITCTKGSCSATVTPVLEIVKPPVASTFDGYVYGADCSTFRGWAWDGTKPNTPVTVEILDGPNVIGTLTAGEFRPDLLAAGKGNGNHAFVYAIPQSLVDGALHSLSARVRNSGFILKGSPKALVCRPGRDSGNQNKPPVAPTPTILIAPVTAQVNVPFSATLVAFTDPEGEELIYDLYNLPAGLEFDPFDRIIFGTPKVAGTFVLAYEASDFIERNSVSFTLTVLPESTSAVTGSFDGYLDKVECGTIRGWVWDRNKPNAPVTVEFYTGTTVWGSTVANIYRDDLKNAGKGNGAHAYRFEVPAVLKDGQTRSIRARVLGSTYDLKDSGKSLTCNSPARFSAENGAELQVTVLGNPVLQQVQVEVRGAEGRPLHLQLTDASGRQLSHLQIEQAKAIERPVFNVQQQPAGILLLRATSGLKSVTLKILKP